jgi:glycosyltransferase involved in cell wall biosynthesis
MRLGDQVHFLGAVPVAELQALFETARFLIFPSLFEGLGLPILEAFQFRLPVLASNAACIPEIVGDAGLIFDVKDNDAISHAMLAAVRNPGLLDELRDRGTARLRRLSRATMARMFATCYRHAARAPLNDEQRALLSEMTSDGSW